MKKYKNIFILIAINILVIALSVKTNIFGSTMDFLNQHVVFPEYLRQTFYETKKVLPSFAINLGAGQNIYNIAYYGLLNPIILLSYLFPFIKMIDYIIITNIILLLSSELLFYKFMKTKFDDKLAFILTLIFTLSGPLIFHYHRQYMFVNYMPFLILALISIDKKKYINLAINIFLIITTSFYYSIPSIITIIIYFIYNNKLKIKELLKLIISIIIPIITSSILLLPTLNAIIETRINVKTNIINLLLPNINLDNLLYGSYSPGLTSILVISLIYLIYKKEKRDTFLFISISILAFIPLILYLLNGGLYLRAKALIPLLPLLVYIIGIFLNALFENKINIKKFINVIILINLIILINYHEIGYYLDLTLMIILILIYAKTKKQNIIIFPLIILNIIMCLNLNNNETYITKKQYENIKQEQKIDTNYRTINLNDISTNVNRTNNYTTSIYSSTINKYYKNLYHNIFKISNSEINNLSLPTTTNILFNKYMGVKYIISDNELTYPYIKLENNIYKLETLPIGYANSNTVNKEYYDSLEYPYNLDILLNYIVDEDSENKPTSNIEEVKLEYTYELGENIKIINNKLYVTEDGEIKIKLKENLENKILFINIYNEEEQEENISMTINGEKNLLTKKNWTYPNNNTTFYYCLNNVIDTLEISLTKGIYNVDNIKTYILDKNIELTNYDEFNIEKINTEEIYGNINVSEDGYFILKIPYDKGFKIEVNNEKMPYEILDEAFIGFKIKKGTYNIKIVYNPPLLKSSKIISIIGLILFVIASIYEKKNSNDNRHIKK